MGSMHSRAGTTDAGSGTTEEVQPAEATPILMGRSFLVPSIEGSPVDLCFASSSISFGPRSSSKSTPPPLNALFQICTPSASQSMLDMSPQSMLDMLPYPAVLVDPKHYRPLGANHKALALFGSTDLGDLQHIFTAGVWPDRVMLHFADEASDVPASQLYSHVFESQFILPDNRSAVLYSFFGVGEMGELSVPHNQEEGLEGDDLEESIVPWEHQLDDGIDDDSIPDPSAFQHLSPSPLEQHPLAWPGDQSSHSPGPFRTCTISRLH